MRLGVIYDSQATNTKLVGLPVLALPHCPHSYWSPGSHHKQLKALSLLLKNRLKQHFLDKTFNMI
jgi:hypothetical protein